MAEKFTRWADKSTGINPFLVDSIRAPNNFFEKLIYYGKLIFLGFPRLCLASLLLAFFIFNLFFSEILLLGGSILYMFHSLRNERNMIPSYIFLGAAILSVLPIPTSIPYKFAVRYLNYAIFLLAAFLLGIFYEITPANTYRVVGVPSKGPSNTPSITTAGRGDIIISNLNSALELFFYQSLCSPLYVFPLFNSSTTSLCAGFSFLSALSYTLNLGTDQLRQTGEPLTVLIQKASKLNRPIVLFIEGTKTNGTGILEFPSKIFDGVPSTNIILSGITYSNSQSSREITRTSPTCSVGSHFERFLWLASQPSFPQSGTLTYLSKFLPPLDEKVRSKQEGINQWIEEIRSIFSKLVNKKTLKLSLLDYESFCQYYNALRNGKIAEAKSIADSRGK